MNLIEVLKKELNKKDTSNITITSIHGIETIINKNDEIKEENNFLYIIHENGEIEIILFTDNIFKMKITKTKVISEDDIYAV